MDTIEEAMIKVYLLQRDRLREQADRMLEQAADPSALPTCVVPMDVPAIDKLVGSQKPYLYFDRQRMRFTHIVHAFVVKGKASEPHMLFPVQRVVTIPEGLG